MRARVVYEWCVVGTAVGLFGWQVLSNPIRSDLLEVIFWAGLFAASDVVPIQVGAGSLFTMSYAVAIAVALTFRTDPASAMLIVGLGAFDLREFTHEVSLSRAAFNRAQLMIAVLCAAAVAGWAQDVTQFPGVLVVPLSALVNLMANLLLVAAGVNFVIEERWLSAVGVLLPKPLHLFLLSAGLLGLLGSVASFVYRSTENFLWTGVMMGVPMLFARLSLLEASKQVALSQKLRDQQEGLLRATNQVFGERERERNRIAADIHDSSLQYFVAGALAAREAQSAVEEKDLPAAVGPLQSVNKALDLGLSRLRDALAHLEQTPDLDHGMEKALLRLAEDARTLWSTDIETRWELDREVPDAISLTGIQIVREGVVNAIRHAQATHIQVSVSMADGFLRLVVEDDGIGVKEIPDAPSGHLGLRLMRERAEQVGGSFELSTKGSGGSVLEVLLPMGV